MPIWVIICIYLYLLCAVDGAIGNRPIIGALLVTSTADDAKVSGDAVGQSYLYTSYKALLEQSGAGVVPIFLNQSDEYYDSLLSRLNGILLPGGYVDAVGSQYGNESYRIFKAATKMNDAGNYLPILGICLGLQEMTTWPFNPQKNLTIDVAGTYNVALPLKFTTAAYTSRMFGSMPDKLIRVLATQNITPNYHHYGLAMRTYKAYKELYKFYTVTSTNTDTRGLEFVSSMEARQYPFYAVQWHPEKMIYWFQWGSKLNHSPDAVQVGQYISNFFVNEARKSKQSFKTQDELSRFMFDNYPIRYDPNSNVASYFFNSKQIVPPFNSIN